MAMIPRGARVKVSLPTGTAHITLREPSNEELNDYQSKKFDVPDKATPAETMLHVQRAQAAFFDLLIENVEDLEDEHGPVTAKRADAIPAAWKSEIVFRRFDRTPIELDEKN